MSWTYEEQETIIAMSRADKVVRIYSAIPKHIKALRANPTVTEVSVHTSEGHEEVEFTVPVDRWSPTGGVKRSRTLTDEQRAAMADRLRKAREKNG